MNSVLKKLLLYLKVYGYVSPETVKEVDKLFHHLKEAIKDDMKKDTING